MKVLFVLDRFDPDLGGSEKLFKILTDELRNSNTDVTVLCCKHSKRKPESHIVEFPFRSRILFALVGNLWVLYYARKADVIHSSSFFSGIACTLAVLFGKKAVLTYHELWLNRWNELPYLSAFQKWQLKTLERFLVAMPFQRVVGVSEFTYQGLLTAYPSNRVRKVMNALLVPKSLPEKTRGNSYLMYGRLGVSKGWHLINELKTQSLPPDFHLQLVLPQEPKWLWQKINAQLKAPFIEVKNELPEEELFALIQKAKAVLIPSYSEGFGFAAAECSAMNTPIIHSGRGALNEVVYGTTVKMTEYSGKGLAEAIWKFERGEVEVIQKKNSDVLEMANAYLSIYRELVS